MLPHMEELSQFLQFWYVTITPYGKEIEPGVPDKKQILQSVRTLSGLVGKRCVGWRYDPIFLSERYTIPFHLDAFEKMAGELEGYTEQVVISFIDLYEKTKRNFPEAKEVQPEERLILKGNAADRRKAWNAGIYLYGRNRSGAVWHKYIRLHDKAGAGACDRGGACCACRDFACAKRLPVSSGQRYRRIQYLPAFLPVLLCEL